MDVSKNVRKCAAALLSRASSACSISPALGSPTLFSAHRGPALRAYLVAQTSYRHKGRGSQWSRMASTPLIVLRRAEPSASPTPLARGNEARRRTQHDIVRVARCLSQHKCECLPSRSGSNAASVTVLLLQPRHVSVSFTWCRRRSSCRCTPEGVWKP